MQPTNPASPSNPAKQSTTPIEQETPLTPAQKIALEALEGLDKEIEKIGPQLKKNKLCLIATIRVTPEKNPEDILKIFDIAKAHGCMTMFEVLNNNEVLFEFQKDQKA